MLISHCKYSSEGNVQVILGCVDARFWTAMKRERGIVSCGDEKLKKKRRYSVKTHGSSTPSACDIR